LFIEKHFERNGNESGFFNPDAVFPEIEKPLVIVVEGFFSESRDMYADSVGCGGSSYVDDSECPDDLGFLGSLGTLAIKKLGEVDSDVGVVPLKKEVEKRGESQYCHPKNPTSAAFSRDFFEVRFEHVSKRGSPQIAAELFSRDFSSRFERIEPFSKKEPKLAFDRRE
jgi:hypothetical protein